MEEDTHTTQLLETHGEEQPREAWNLKRLMTLKVFLIVSALLSLGCLVVSFVLDSHIATTRGEPVRFETLSVDIEIPDATIGALKVAVVQPDGQSKKLTYSDLNAFDAEAATRPIDDSSLEVFLGTDLLRTIGFKLPITRIGYAAWLAIPVYVLEGLAVLLTALSIVFQLWWNEEPDSFILRPGISAKVSITKREMFRSGLPGFMLLMSASISMILTVLISSFMHNMVYRLVVYAIFNSGVSGDNLAAYRVAMDGESVSNKQEQLKFMQFVGKFLTDRKHVNFSWSFYGLMASIGINIVVIFVLYWKDNNAARAKVEAAEMSTSSTLSKQEAAARAEHGWNQLPWHCRVRSIWVSLAIFFGGLTVTAIGGNVARRRGVKMNRHPFEVSGAPQTFIHDVVISHTKEYFFSTGGIVDAAVMVFMPIMVMLAIVSIDRLKFASKVLELNGIVFFMRGWAVMATIMPTLYNVLQHPQCWDPPGNTLSDMLAEKVFCFIPALIFVYSIVYGPYSYKPALISAVLLAATALSSLIVVGRLHYTADVVVAIILSALLVIMNAPVWKLLFSFRKSQLGIGSVSAIDKVPGYLELCIDRLNVYTSTVQENLRVSGEDGSNTESWAKVDVVYAELGELIETAVFEAKQAEFEDETDEEQRVSDAIEHIDEDEQRPLLTSV